MRLWRDDWAGALGWLVLTGYPIVSSWITGLQAHGLPDFILSALLAILSALLAILSALLVILSALLVILSALLVILSAVEGSLLPKLQSCR